MHAWGIEPDYKKLAIVRSRITQVLLGKGLREGEGKWHEVFARHMHKEIYWRTT